MSTVTSAPSSGIAGQTITTRVVSIDIFRGLTMAVMIFVNDLASVHGLSKWTYHMPEKVDAMTYVDMVFPAFLFIVGMALPIAVRQRLRRNPSVASLCIHVVLRAISLLVLGLILANADGGDAARMHISSSAWALLALAGAILLWGVYGGLNRRIVMMLRGAGAVLIVWMFAIFRRATPGGGWIDFSYPEILGLIGLTYFAVCLLYIPTRRWSLAPIAWFIALVAFNAACVAGWFPIARVSMYLWPFGNGAMASIVMAGVVTTGIFLDGENARTPARKIATGLLLALVCFLAGWALTPLGISKIRATPTWSLWSIAASCALFAALYWICDVRHHTRWAWLLRPAGSNTLLTYLLPDIYYFLSGLLGLAYLLGQFNAGWPGVIRAIVFTVAMLLLSHVLTRAKLRLQL